MISPDGFLKVDNINGIPVFIDPVSTQTKEYKDTKMMIPKFQVIHNAGNSKADDTANNNFMKNDDYVLWHFTVDENSITQGHSIFRSAFHAGDGATGKGNLTGIGIEIADNGNVEQSCQNAFNLMYYLDQNIPDLVIKPHQFFSGKYCPRWILDHWKWSGFIERYENFKFTAGQHWAAKNYRSLISKGLTIHDQRFNDTITRGEIFALLDQIVK